MTQSPFMIRVRECLRLRQMAYATEKTYCHWIRYFILQQGIQHPDEMVAEKVIEFLTFLAVKKHVSPNTQNQAFNALLFYSNMFCSDLLKTCKRYAQRSAAQYRLF